LSSAAGSGGICPGRTWEGNVEPDAVEHFEDTAVHAKDLFHNAVDFGCACHALSDDVERFALDSGPNSIE
jgi:hypothetical protein